MTSIEEKKEYSTTINRLFDTDEYAEARKLLLKLLKKEPHDHWLLTQVSATHYEERNYKKALAYSEKALAASPLCPMVLWDYAGTLDMLKRNDEAIRIYNKLVRRGANRIAHGECGEGIRSARGLVNDCRYRLGLIYAGQGNFELAEKFMKSYIANRNRNCPSIYNQREVKKDMAMILECKDARQNDDSLST